MENQKVTPQQPIITPPTSGQGPIIVSPGTPSSNVSPVSPPQKHDDKNKGLIIVAVILVILISVLGIVYYLIIKQSATNKATVVPPVVIPTAAPPTATPTPTEEEVLDEANLEDPTVDITPLQQEITNL